jgi:hypothetical protein
MTDIASIIGLRIQLDRTKDVPCGDCGQHDVVIGAGVGPHIASLRCARCDRHRGWLPRGLVEFLLDVTRRFGRPTESLIIKDSEHAQFVRRVKDAECADPQLKFRL